MKKSIASKKLTRKTLRTIQGSGVGEICCAVSCANENECAYWTTLPAKCPLLPVCL
ncbi:hypothetical protein [Chryseobacterium gleum]|jgi:hypothetical protein|uniref:hypothetical protein n=1 Tax=Chryseobacterium gleum TaxID=250 RepID=UPI0013F177D3|nr:hypothetical protein [Chryseobacterium gleum]